MARDAIARQYDVDKNSVTMTCDNTEKKGYRPGTITFQAKKGRSIDIEKLRESIAATRLSGGTNMKMDWLEITATGEITGRAELVLKVSGSGQEFVLREGEKDGLGRLREALGGGAKIASVTGRIQGWNGRFPDVLKAVAGQKRPVLQVMDFEISK